MRLFLKMQKTFFKNFFLLCINVFILFPFKKILKINEKKVVYIPVHFQCQGNAYALLKKWVDLFGDKFTHIYLCKHKNSKKDNVHYIRFGLTFLYHYATAKYIIRESEFNSIGLWPSKKSIVVQLWHASGAFKKFGLHTKRNYWIKFWRKKDIEKWNVVFCSSNYVVDIYSKAFGGFDKEKIVVNGLPRNDVLFKLSKMRNDLRKNFKIRNEKLILFAPTFREKTRREYYISMVEDIKFLSKSLTEEYKLAVRLHPNISKLCIDFSCILDLNSIAAEEALVISDILITDYSSIIFDFALLEKPMIFYAPDLHNYYNRRGFYFDYETFVPGPISYTKEELLKNIKEYDWTKWKDKVLDFKSKFNPYFDGKNSERAIKKILEIGEKK